MKSMSLKSKLHLLIGATALLAASAQAAPVLSTYAVAYAPGNSPDFGTVSGTTLRANSSMSDAFSHSNATTSVTYGVVKAQVSGSNTSTTGYGIGASTSAGGGASAAFMDDIVLSNATLNGTRGLLTLAYYIDYDIVNSITGNAGGYSNGSLSFTAWLNSGYTQLTDYENTNGNSSRTLTSNDYYGYRIGPVGRQNYLYLTSEFTWGQAIRTGLGVDANVSTHALNGQTAAFDFNAMNSGYWGGIVSASANGVDVKDFTMSSGSGVDYSSSFAPAQAVPEPGSIALIAAGLAGLALRRRQQRARR